MDAELGIVLYRGAVSFSTMPNFLTTATRLNYNRGYGLGDFFALLWAAVTTDRCLVAK